MNDAAVAVENLHKTYGWGARAVPALRAVTIAVAPGEIYGLLGRNGAGKTTLVKVLLNIVRPSRGRAAILGRAASSPAARQSVGYLPEDHRLPEYRTGEGLLHYYAALSGVSRAERRTRVPELLELISLGPAANRKIRTYSKGMKQRLGLAQALVHDPQVLFLDEPTDGVDPVGRAEIRDLLLKLKQQGKTVFLNSHLLSEVERLCDRVGIMEKGELVREGSIDALTHTGSVFTLTTVPPLDDAARAALAQIVLKVESAGDVCTVELREDADLDRVVDFLRARQIGLRALSRKRSSLEDVFLQAVDCSPRSGA